MSLTATPHAHPAVHHLAIDRPWTWIARGWVDLWRTPALSLGYAAVFVCLGLALSVGLYLIDYFYLVLPLASGFLILAPILAVGFYRVSRSLERGQRATAGQMLTAWREHLGPLSAMGATLLVLFLVWIRVSLLIFSLTFTEMVPTWDRFVETLFLSSQGLPFALATLGAGALFALVAFAISAFAIPMIFDRGTNVIDAILTSVEAVRANGTTMLLWAFLIVLFTGVGLLTLYLGLLVTLPMLAYATWHAYRDTLEP